MYNGAPAEVFYSASCGGRSENASALWPRANLPYLRSVEDDVHAEDTPWTLEITLDAARRALARAGFAGERLRDVRVDGRTGSGRVSRLTVAGLRPDMISGDAFRTAVGARELRSTAFSVTRDGDTLRFTGQGYGHGIGMCVVGSGRRARRGETARAILGWYYPGLQLVTLDPLDPASSER
jgi:stage II sporulation protein D